MARNERMSAETAADRKLSCYRKLKSIIEAAEFLGEYAEIDAGAVKADLFEIRRSVMSLPPSPERLLLIQHYINGNTFEVCAELLGISRRSVFRMRKRALALYARAEEETEEKII